MKIEAGGVIGTLVGSTFMTMILHRGQSSSQKIFATVASWILALIILQVMISIINRIHSRKGIKSQHPIFEKIRFAIRGPKIEH